MMSPKPCRTLSQVRWESSSERDTQQLGQWLAEVLRGGDIVALNGELGTGKTRLVGAIVAALCPQDQRVSSPTFVLMQRYDTDPPVYHFDAYRIADTDEFLELGVEEIFAEGGICLVEWAERVADVLPRGCLRIDIRATGPLSREFLLTGTDSRSTEIIQSVQARIDAPSQSTGCVTDAVPPTDGDQ